MIRRILLYAAVLLSGCGGGDITSKQAPVVAFYGDSITSGTHSTKYDEWIPAQWDVSPVQYISSLAGIHGIDYSANGSSAVDANIKADDSSITVIRFGVADSAHNTPTDAFSKAITRLVCEARAYGKTVVITGLSRNAFDNTGRLNDIMRERAATLNTPFVDVYSLEYSNSDLADPLHPGLDYSKRIGKLVSSKLLEVIGK